jgi:hypothetical protein
MGLNAKNTNIVLNLTDEQMIWIGRVTVAFLSNDFLKSIGLSYSDVFVKAVEESGIDPKVLADLTGIPQAGSVWIENEPVGCGSIEPELSTRGSIPLCNLEFIEVMVPKLMKIKERFNYIHGLNHEEIMECRDIMREVLDFIESNWRKENKNE